MCSVLNFHFYKPLLNTFVVTCKSLHLDCVFVCYNAFGHLSIRIQNCSIVLMGYIMEVMMSMLPYLYTGFNSNHFLSVSVYRHNLMPLLSFKLKIYKQL